MKVKRIVANIAASDVAAARRFYHEVLGLDLLMDQGWIVTYGSREKTSVQVSIMSEVGSGTPPRSEMFQSNAPFMEPEKTRGPKPAMFGLPNSEIV